MAFKKNTLSPYSPLGFGVLSGKYLNKQKPEGARLTLDQLEALGKPPFKPPVRDLDWTHVLLQQFDRFIWRLVD